MPGTKVRATVITPEQEGSFRERLDLLKDQTRKRAFQLYCRRTGPDAQKADWAEAERETVLSTLAGIEDNEDNIRITTSVPDVDAGHLTIDVLNDSIVVEGVSAADPGMTRYSVFPLRSPITASAVRAELNNGYLTIVAPKAKV